MPRNRTKKVTLFIVEGPSDETTLLAVMSELLETDTEEVKIEVVHGDILTKEFVDETNVVSSIIEFLQFIMNVYKIYLPRDIKQIISIIDTDGTFIPNENVTESLCDHIVYSLEDIRTNNVDYIRKKNARRKRVAHKLINTYHITLKDNNQRYRIPYRIFFFSRNLEHALHDKIEHIDEEGKKRLSETFDDYYGDNPEKFLELIQSPELAAAGNYRESWMHIAEGTNSLKRKTNLNIFFDEYCKEEDDSR